MGDKRPWWEIAAERGSTIQPGVARDPAPQQKKTISGVNGQLSFDGQFVTIERSGLMAKGYGGTKRIPVSSISEVVWKAPGSVNGYISFLLYGHHQARGSMGGRNLAAAKDDYTVVFARKHRDKFEQMRSSIEAALAGLHAVATPVVPAPSQSQASVADELAKLAALHRDGILSDEEFIAAKRKLLGA